MSDDKKYVRCRFCDSAFTPEDVEFELLPDDDGVGHRQGYFTCPACCNQSESFIFPDDPMDSELN